MQALYAAIAGNNLSSGHFVGAECKTAYSVLSTRFPRRMTHWPILRFLRHSLLQTTQNLPSGRNSRIDIGLRMCCGDKKRLVLAARHINAAVEQAPKILGVPSSIALAGSVPVSRSLSIEKQRHHAADASDGMRN